MTTFHVDSEVGCAAPSAAAPPGPRAAAPHARPTAATCSSTTCSGSSGPARSTTPSPTRCATEGVEVLDVGDLLAETIKDDVARSVAARSGRDRARARPRPRRRRPRLLRGPPTPTTVASHLIGGLTASELPTGVRGWAAAAEVGGPSGFVLPPLPNHLFTRDTSCWIYGGVSLNPMAMPARRRETANLEAIYRFHPLFGRRGHSARWYGGVDDDHGQRHDRGRRRPRDRARRRA